MRPPLTPCWGPRLRARLCRAHDQLFPKIPGDQEAMSVFDGGRELDTHVVAVTRLWGTRAPAVTELMSPWIDVPITTDTGHQLASF